MGVFPDIFRIWITIDNKLFIWNCLNEKDLVEYGELDEKEIITAVAVVKPKPGVFGEDVQRLLVIATPVEVFLLELTFSGESFIGELRYAESTDPFF